MIREQVIVTQVKITKGGQVKHFQVRLPKNTKRIIGIEVGGRFTRAQKRDGTEIEIIPKETEAIKQP